MKLLVVIAVTLSAFAALPSFANSTFDHSNSAPHNVIPGGPCGPGCLAGQR